MGIHAYQCATVRWTLLLFTGTERGRWTRVGRSMSRRQARVLMCACVRACVGVRRVSAPGRPVAQAFAAGGLVTSTPAEDARTRVPCARTSQAAAPSAGAVPLADAAVAAAISVGPPQLFAPGAYAATARATLGFPGELFRAFSAPPYPALVPGFREENPESPKFGFPPNGGPPGGSTGCPGTRA